MQRSGTNHLRLIQGIFSRPNKVVALQRIDLSRNADPVQSLQARLERLERQIGETSRALIQAQAVSVRSMLSGSSDFLGGVQKKIVESSARNSVSWHQSRLLEMTQERRELEDQLDRLTGQVWPKRLRLWLLWTAIGAAIIVASTVFVMGVFTAIYLLPIWGTLLLVLFLFQRKR